MKNVQRNTLISRPVRMQSCDLPFSINTLGMLGLLRVLLPSLQTNYFSGVAHSSLPRFYEQKCQLPQRVCTHLG